MKTRLFPKFSALSILVLVAALAAACGDSESEGPSENPTSEFFELAHERETPAPESIDRDAVERLEQANTASALRFYRELRQESPNLVFSPLSISRALASYYEEGHEESDAFEALFGFTPDVSTQTAWQHLYYQATNRDEFDDVPREDRSLFSAQDIYWVHSGGAEESVGSHEFFDRVHYLDLTGEPMRSRELINGWIFDESGGMLEDFVPESVFANPDLMAIATNVVYFLGAWSPEFEDADPIEFKGLSGTSNLEAFKGTAEMQAVSRDEVTLVRIPYMHRYAHWVVMPNEDFEAFADGFDETVWADLKAQQSRFNVALEMVEFNAESDPAIGNAIESIREETMTQGGTLTGAISEEFLHTAAIEVTKEGTRAAAATAVIEYGNADPEPAPLLEVTVDRPFIHIIEDSKSGSILFMGEFTGPSN